MTEKTTYLAKGMHIKKGLITVHDGEKIEGPAFPLLWTREAATVS